MYYTRFETRFCDMILAGDEQGLQHLHLDTGEGKKGPFELPAHWLLNPPRHARRVRRKR